MKALALELGSKYGITVNTVATGEIATPINDMTGEDASREKNPRETVPAGRLVTQRDCGCGHVLSFQ